METATVEIVSARNPKLLGVPPGGLGVIVPPTPITARTLFAQNPGVVLAVDGPMFSYCAGEPHDYDRYQCGSVDFLLSDTRTGVSVPGKPEFQSSGITFSISNGQIVGQPGRNPQPGSVAAFQLYPTLVQNGRVVVSERPPEHPDGQSNHRIAFGKLNDGRAFFAYGYASMYDFAQQLLGEGAVSAGYTDGGGSASLVMRMPDGSLQGSDANDPGGRRVPSWIVWTRDPNTDLVLVDTAAIKAKRLETIALATIVALAGGVTLWLVFKKR